MKKNEMIGFKTTTEIRKELQQIAKEEDRSVSYIINKIVTIHLEGKNMKIEEVIAILDEIIDDINEAENQRFPTREEERNCIISNIERIKKGLKN